jgi:hypothetical protein
MNTIMWNKVPDYAVSVDTRAVKYPVNTGQGSVVKRTYFQSLYLTLTKKYAIATLP